VELFANLVGTPATSDVAAWGRQREAEGWHGLGVADHLWVFGTTFHHWAVCIGVLATATTRPLLTSCFTNNLLHSPVEVAQAAMTAQQVSGGRFELGLGAGWSAGEIEGIGHRFPPPAERVDRYREAVTIVGALLREGRCQFRGDHYDVDVPNLGPSVTAAPPLVASVGGPRTIREITPLVDRVEVAFNAAATRGGALSRPDLVVLGEDHLDLLIAQVREVRADVPIAVFLTVACGDDAAMAPLRDSGGLGFDGLVGSPAEVAATLLRVGTKGIDRLQVTPATPTTLELLAPHLPLDPRG
jgi:alkanesulfonate monooxygenase SsuD/methylene tetrahydromethanopterin reductase-like flavin-dependent oxidoreductase (luciferase family)